MERYDEIRIHVVQRDETIWMIASEEFGDEERYREIMELNHLESVDVHPGQILKLPGE